jgi:AraC-like DNA-binding protein
VEVLFPEIKLDLVTARYARLGREWKGTDYSDNWSRVYWIDRGVGRVRHHGREILLRPGRLYLIPAGTIFSYDCDRSLFQHWVHFTALLPGGLPLFVLVEPEYEVRPADVRQTRYWFRRLETLITAGHPADELEKTGILLQMIAAFLGSASRETMTSRRKAHLRFRATLANIEARLAGPLRVSDLAREAHLERTYFSRVFRECLGVKPAEYIIRRRVERAKPRLWETDDSLGAVAESLGFSDAFHFSKCFKRVTGLAPSEFRTLRRRQSGCAATP